MTQLDIARRAGVSRATVTLALNDYPRMSPSTRARVQAIAAEMGYVRDPVFASLAAYRYGRRGAEARGTLVWLANTTVRHAWRTVPHFKRYYEAACERATFHGYDIMTADLGDGSTSIQKVGALAREGTINGVLICPHGIGEARLEQLPWSEVAAVTFGYSITSPVLNAVAPSQFRAAFRVVEELMARSFSRIGLIIDADHDERTDHNYLAGYLAGCEAGGIRSLPPLLDPTKAFRRWMRDHQPEAVIVARESYVDVFRRHGFRVPTDVVVAGVALSSRNATLPGVIEPNEEIGASAVDMLVSMVHRGERGIPRRPHRLVVEGDWFDPAAR